MKWNIHVTAYALTINKIEIPLIPAAAAECNRRLLRG